ncbi:MAG: radical SAM protein [Phycisphaerae bacterium]|nr:radical SAM protein [Phycisphaerae bacterium]
MPKVIIKQHKTNFLKPSGLRCLANLPTVNITAGCAHNCVYCYTKGYSNYPGDTFIEVYENMAERVADEIQRKRKKPAAVYFCPSCDPFQPLAEVQQITFEVMKVLLENGIGIQFVTKGAISKEIFGLFKKYNSKIAGQIGLVVTDEDILNVIEPNAADIHRRLEQIKKLIKIGVRTMLRCDPIIFSLTDSEKQLQSLFSMAAETGCREVAVSYLFLRPSITASLKNNITDKNVLNRILSPFSENVKLPIGLKNSSGIFLPAKLRGAAFEKVRQIASNFNIVMHICGCKNRDITETSCCLTRQPEDYQSDLF